MGKECEKTTDEIEKIKNKRKEQKKRKKEHQKEFLKQREIVKQHLEERKQE